MPNQTITLLPVGATTPQGCERINRAMKDFGESHHRVANLLSTLLKRVDDSFGLKDTLIRAGFSAEDAAYESQEAMEAINQRDALQEELILATCGRPKGT